MEFYHDQHIGIYKKAFPDEWCDNIIKYFQSNSTIFTPRNTPSVIDRHGHLWDEDLKHEFINFFSPYFELYIKKYQMSPQPLSVVGWKIQKTLPSEGYHSFHIEHGNELDDFRRVGVWTLYLNDVEEGGETEFLYQLKRVKPEKGTLCIFPAGYTHVHRGNTPLSGEKYIMTGWLDMDLPDNIEIIENKLRNR